MGRYGEYSSMRTGYIYALVDPRTNEVCYVGQTVLEPKARLSNHLSRPGNKMMFEWIADLEINGLRPTITILERDVDTALLGSRERHWMVVMAARHQPLKMLYNADMLHAWHYG